MTLNELQKMTNVIKYRQFPDRDEFVALYGVKTQKELAKIYECTELRIHNWILHFGLSLKQHGGGHNRKYHLPKSQLEHLVREGYTNQEIATMFGMSVSNLNRYLKRYKLKRNYNKTKFAEYSRKVRWKTEATYAQNKVALNPLNKPRTLCGVEGGYQLDHIISVRECFNLNISIDECSGLSNLQLIPWESNLQRRKFNAKKELSCSI